MLPAGARHGWEGQKLLGLSRALSWERAGEPLCGGAWEPGLSRWGGLAAKVVGARK